MCMSVCVHACASTDLSAVFIRWSQGSWETRNEEEEGSCLAAPSESATARRTASTCDQDGVAEKKCSVHNTHRFALLLFLSNLVEVRVDFALPSRAVT